MGGLRERAMRPDFPAVLGMDPQSGSVLDVCSGKAPRLAFVFFLAGREGLYNPVSFIHDRAFIYKVSKLLRCANTGLNPGYWRDFEKHLRHPLRALVRNRADMPLARRMAKD